LREEKLVENTKKCMCLKGRKSSSIVNAVLTDLVRLFSFCGIFSLIIIINSSRQYTIKKPFSRMFTKKSNPNPFEDSSSLEFLSGKADCSLFAFGCHSKKRPHNLVLGRCYNTQVLDMWEFAINPDTYLSLSSFTKKRKAVTLGSTPCLLFNGSEFGTYI